MATLLQRLGLVTGLGLAAIAMEGCERTVEVRSHALGFAMPSEEPCNSRPLKKTEFTIVTEHIQRTTVIGIPLSPNLVRTVEFTYVCNPPGFQGRNVNYYIPMYRTVHESNGEVKNLGWYESVDPITGQIVDSRYRGGSSL